MPPISNMKTLVVIVNLLYLVLGASIVDVFCPDSCSCQVKDEHYETSCTSFEFIKKLMPKQISSIVGLNITNASVVNIDPKLQYLKSLNHLDLSNNHIESLPKQFPYLPKLKSLSLRNNRLKEVSFSQLPNNLESIDLSNNFFVNLPLDWAELKHLKTLHFANNFINCDCNNLLIHERMLKYISITDLTCYDPKEFQGRSLDSINCSMVAGYIMMRDEGSGEVDLITTSTEKDEFNETDEEFLDYDKSNTTDPEIIEESSGDYGSGFSEIQIEPLNHPKLKPCVINCSTPKPFGIDDEINASTPPSVIDGANIIMEDIFKHDREETTTVPPPPEEEEEEPVIKQSDKSLVETFPTNHTGFGEMERASTKPEEASSPATYIVIGLVTAFIIFLLIYYVNKKKSKKGIRKRNKSVENGFGEEMKPLGNSLEKPIEIVANPEKAALLNGNGKINEAPDRISEEEEEEEVEIRKVEISPQPERVTIKAGEIPDSIPKTPMLVHRQLNSDGEIITTAVSN